ncbi:MAG TPA: hypothetical protein VMN76_03265, partial [Acidobacteriota bacterium]|nr:hypothetical protein [Acidobacteriota bacterium]
FLIFSFSLCFLLSQAPTHQHYEAPSEDVEPGPEGQLAPRLQNLGDHTFPVTTSSAQAQLFINQGLNLSYGFNHAEAARAFMEASRLDPECAMAYWGHALVLGPNINAPMNPEDEPRAYELMQKAFSLASKVSERERAYINALSARYSGNPEDREAGDRAYAAAMRDLYMRYQGDLDAATLFAEALMDLRPWSYWSRDGRPYPGTLEAIEALERVLARNPNHPGANHLYIHMFEDPDAKRAEAAADRLLHLMPGAGHMVHMPSHIYVRVGRYRDAAEANRLAVLADEDYIAQCRAQGIYPLGYYPHNIHFLWMASSLLGDSAEAIGSARKTASQVPVEALEELPFLQGFLVVPYYALVRFGKWEEMAAEPLPPYQGPFTMGIWHYARGIALTALGRLEEAGRELDELTKIVADPALEELPASFSANSAQAILRIAPEVLAGERAAKEGDYDAAIAHLEKAVRFEDSLIYTEPPDWHYPIRHSLGAVLLEAGRAEEAEVVYWDDLKKNPDNGWSLFGLMQALKAQGKDEESRFVEARFRKVWSRADVELNASRF